MYAALIGILITWNIWLPWDEYQGVYVERNLNGVGWETLGYTGGFRFRSGDYYGEFGAVCFRLDTQAGIMNAGCVTDGGCH